MASRSMKPCSFPNCSNLSKESYCEQHSQTTQQGRRFYDKYVRDQQGKGFYHSTEWQRTRKQVLMRDHHLCQHCLQAKRITHADMVHHTKPLRAFWHLRCVLSNLVSLCYSCHNKVHGGGAV